MKDEVRGLNTCFHMRSGEQIAPLKVDKAYAISDIFAKAGRMRVCVTVDELRKFVPSTNEDQ